MLAVVGGSFICERRVAKPLRDTVYHEVQVHRYQCLKCRWFASRDWHKSGAGGSRLNAFRGTGQESTAGAGS